MYPKIQTQSFTATPSAFNLLYSLHSRTYLQHEENTTHNARRCVDWLYGGARDRSKVYVKIVLRFLLAMHKGQQAYIPYETRTHWIDIFATQARA